MPLEMFSPTHLDRQVPCRIVGQLVTMKARQVRARSLGMERFARAVHRTSLAISRLIPGSHDISSGQRALQLLGNDDDNLQKQEIHVLAHKLITSDSNDERTEAVRKMGHLSWKGGPDVAQCCCQNYLMTLISILHQPLEMCSLKTQVVKAIAEICISNKSNQDVARGYGIIETLSELLLQDDRQLRIWSAYALFAVLCGNTANQQAALAIQRFEMRFVRVAMDDWSSWEHNAAEECLLMLGLNERLPVNKLT